MEVAMLAEMSLRVHWLKLQARWQAWRGFATAPQPPSEVVLRRIRYVEREVGLPVKGTMLVLLTYFLFFSGWFNDSMPVSEEAVGFVRTFFLMYFALNVGAGIILRGMDDVSPKLVVRVTYIVAVLDAVMLALLTFVTGGFESILYWLFLGVIIRNTAIIPDTVVQVSVNLFSGVSYFIGCLLAHGLADTEINLIRGTGRGTVTGGAFDETGLPNAESLVFRLLLLVLMTACCAGIQILLDRQRQREAEAREFALKEHQFEAAGRLAAEIAHQLKNPLGIINNAAYNLQKTVREGKTITQQIAIIREEVDRSDRIITELIGYARLAEGKVERVELNDELDRAVDAVLPVAAKFDIRVHRDYTPGLPPLLGQRGHFAEIFNNLLTNAREAMGGRGEIFLATRTGPDFSVVVTVRDTGPGIPPDKLKLIYESYFTTKDKGTGLGLAIVKHNAEMYGGRVLVESELGKGAAFTVTLPARSLMRLRK